MRQELLAMRAKVRDKAPHWRNEEAVREQYVSFCEHIQQSDQRRQGQSRRDHRIRLQAVGQEGYWRTDPKGVGQKKSLTGLAAWPGKTRGKSTCS